MRGLTLGGVAMLSGCNLTDNDSVETALSSMSRFNDRVQGWLFNPNAMAPDLSCVDDHPAVSLQCLLRHR